MIFRIFTIFFLIFSQTIAYGKLNVMTTLPDHGWLVSEVGGEYVNVDSFLTGKQDPHHVDVVPAYVQKASHADIVCFNGLELEIGWLPKVLSKSGNSKVQIGGKGFCDLGKYVSAVEIPQGNIDRSMGDVHAHGNPHYILSPDHMKQAAKGVLETLSINLPEHTKTFQANYENLIRTLDRIKAETQNILKDKKIVAAEYHKEFTYYFLAYQIESVGALEEKPGVAPSSVRLMNFSQTAQDKKVSVILATPFSPKSLLDKFAELSSVKVLTFQAYLSKDGVFSKFEDLQKNIAKELVKNAQGK